VWKRLGVPDPLAEEMAADLASDLEEAEAEGIPASKFLGSSASDPRSFAASWAAERGVIPAPGRAKARRTPRALMVFTALAVIAMVVAVLLLATREPKVTLTARTMRSPLPTSGGGASASSTVHRVQASAAAPIEWMLLFLAIAALGFAAWLWSRSSRSRPPTAPA
jgi:hypothetical protein